MDGFFSIRRAERISVGRRSRSRWWFRGRSTFVGDRDEPRPERLEAKIRLAAVGRLNTRPTHDDEDDDFDPRATDHKLDNNANHDQLFNINKDQNDFSSTLSTFSNSAPINSNPNSNPNPNGTLNGNDGNINKVNDPNGDANHSTVSRKDDFTAWNPF